MSETRVARDSSVRSVSCPRDAGYVEFGGRKRALTYASRSPMEAGSGLRWFTKALILNSGKKNQRRRKNQKCDKLRAELRSPAALCSPASTGCAGVRSWCRPHFPVTDAAAVHALLRVAAVKHLKNAASATYQKFNPRSKVRPVHRG